MNNNLKKIENIILLFTSYASCETFRFLSEISSRDISDMFCEAKVSHLTMNFIRQIEGRHQHVIRLQVSVDHPAPVQERHRLRHVERHHQPVVVPHLLVVDVLAEVPERHELGHERVLGGEHAVPDELHDVGAPQLLEHRALLLELDGVPVLLEDLDGHLLRPPLPVVDGPVAPAPDLPDELEVVVIELGGETCLDL